MGLMRAPSRDPRLWLMIVAAQAMWRLAPRVPDESRIGVDSGE